jgi:polysaccharide deacetylase 2 family uncharacterized protein YibQ
VQRFLLLCAVVLSLVSTTSSASGRLAIVIDDIGYNLKAGERTARLPGAITLAVIPFTPYGTELAHLGHAEGKEIMLHAPMSNHKGFALGKGGLTESMTEADIIASLRASIANVPHVVGVNNHMGSLLTERATVMGWIMQELQAQSLYFIDSRTTAQTQALIEAEKIGLPSRKRDVFLDDTQTHQAIKQQLERAVKLASVQGDALAIGHPYPETLALLETLQPLLDRYDVKLVPASALLRRSIPRTEVPTTSTRRVINHCIAPPLSLWPRPWYPQDPFTLTDEIYPRAN